LVRKTVGRFMQAVVVDYLGQDIGCVRDMVRYEVVPIP
jgi:hypothetical protein